MAGVAKHRVRVLMMRMAWISFSVAAMPGVAQAPIEPGLRWLRWAPWDAETPEKP